MKLFTNKVPIRYSNLVLCSGRAAYAVKIISAQSRWLSAKNAIIIDRKYKFGKEKLKII